MKALFVVVALACIGLSFACHNQAGCANHTCDAAHHPSCNLFSRQCVCRSGATHTCTTDVDCTCDANHHGVCGTTKYCHCALGGKHCDSPSDCSDGGSTACIWNGFFGQRHDGQYHCNRNHHCYCH